MQQTSSLGAPPVLRRALRRVAARTLHRPPDFLIVGTQKGGTTSLHAYLKEHPGILAPEGPKEFHFFDVYRDRGLNWYLSQFPTRIAARGRLTFEATPDYMEHPGALADIRRTLGRPRLIAVLRDPVERAFSAWRMWHGFVGHPVKGAKADRRSFAQAIDEELAAPDGQRHLPFRYVAKGQYAEQIAQMRRLFPQDRILLLEYRQMGEDLQGFLDRICGFLGLPPFPPEQCRALGRTRHWVSPAHEPTPEDRAAMARLRAHYAPHDAALARMLGHAPGWRRD